MERGAFARSQMQGRYRDAAQLRDAGLDGVIVTGAAPRARNLRDEPYWAQLAALVDQVAAGAAPSLWSCLAAHAAVLHLDGVERRRWPAKLTGVFSWERAGDEAALLGLPPRGVTPHSRFNDLAEDDLTAKGYRILTRSPRAGVDLFAKRFGGSCLFLQGHPEYDADSLLREFKRDLARWTRGESEPPAIPAGYFPAALERRLHEMVASDRGAADGASAPSLARALRAFAPARLWSDAATATFGAFLAMAAAEKGRPVGRIATAS